MIQEIKTINNTILSLEFKKFPNQGVLWEIIEKNQSGKIFELSDDTVLVMENCYDPFVFIAGLLTDEAVSDVISLVSSLKFPMVYCNPKYHHLFLKRGWNFHLRMELSLKSRNETEVLNQGMSIQPIKSLDLFKKCSWYKERSESYGSDENFLAYGVGYALCIGSEVVSEAYAGIGNGYAEIGVITHPNYRGKGYATVITSHLIKQCIDSELIPKWSCNANNQASLVGRETVNMRFFSSHHKNFPR